MPEPAPLPDPVLARIRASKKGQREAIRIAGEAVARRALGWRVKRLTVHPDDGPRCDYDGSPDKTPVDQESAAEAVRWAASAAGSAAQYEHESGQGDRDLARSMRKGVEDGLVQAIELRGRAPDREVSPVITGLRRSLGEMLAVEHREEIAAVAAALLASHTLSSPGAAVDKVFRRARTGPAVA